MQQIFSVISRVAGNRTRPGELVAAGPPEPTVPVPVPVAPQPDVTSRLVESEARYRAFIENASDLIQSVLMDGHFEFVNRAWLEKLGYEEHEVDDLVIWDIIHPSSLDHCQSFFMLVMQGQTLTDVEAVFKAKDGTAIPVEGDATPRFVDGKPVATHSFFRDMRERIRTRELEEQNAKLERERQARYLEKMAALGKLSAGLSHELNNPAAAAQRAADQLAGSLGRRDAAVRDLFGVLSVAGWDTLGQTLERARAAGGHEGELDPLEASEREEELGDWLSDHGVERAWEVTPQFVRSGVDAAVLSDLATALPAKSLLPAVAWLAESLAASDLTDVVARSTYRISQLVGAVKSYSHMDRATELEVDVHEGLEDTIIILGHRLKDVTVKRRYDRSLPPIRVLGNSLNQVWTNILDNAIDAMDGRGTITIGTARDDDRLVVTFADSGGGITEEDLPCIFEPFFSTKPQGLGTGLGLDTAWRIVTEEHRGQIDVTSRPGETVFSISLPIPEEEGRGPVGGA